MDQSMAPLRHENEALVPRSFWSPVPMTSGCNSMPISMKLAILSLQRNLPLLLS